MQIMVLGATGNCGLRLTKQALKRGFEVTAYVRNEDKLRSQLKGFPDERLAIIEGTLEDNRQLVNAMSGHDAIINASGNANNQDKYTDLGAKVITAAAEALGDGGRFWLFGGVALLDVPGTQISTLDLPKIPKLFEVHRINMNCVSKTSLDWSMMCPGPMIASKDSKPHLGLRVSIDKWPVSRPLLTYLLPEVFLTLAFKRKMRELTITYEDAAKVILDNLYVDGEFSRKRVGVALPLGVYLSKDYTP